MPGVAIISPESFMHTLVIKALLCLPTFVSAAWNVQG